MHTRSGIIVGCLLMVAAAPQANAEPPPEIIRAFELHVRPLLESRCLACHGESKQEGGLRLDSRAAMLEGGESGPAIIAGRPDASLLIQAVRHQGPEMPPDGRLTPQQVDQLTAWIAAGAVWPEDVGPLRDTAASITDADRQWWAFQPLVKPEVPVIAGDTWSQNPIDRFVLRRLREHGMEPAPRADEVTLVRRVYFDLIGLPPTAEEIDAYLSDSSAETWTHLVDRLLADDRYGEHWARFWLDIVRYAESDGWKADTYRPHQWRYRDYVVHAFNEDMPYPRFVREQLAGDEMAGDNPQALAATGFLRLGIFEYNQRDARSHWNDILNEITDVTGDVFLGMGLACARCHDHKFDPILQTDYFRLRAFFEPLLWTDVVVTGTDDEQAERARRQAEWEAATSDLRARLEALTQPHAQRIHDAVIAKFPLDIQASYFKPAAERTSWDHQMTYLMLRQVADEGGGPRKIMSRKEQEECDRLLDELAKFDHLKPAPAPVLMTVADAPGAISPTCIPGGPEPTAVEPGFLSVLTGDSASAGADISPQGGSSGRRTALAEWIGRADNPLTTRVIVNRIWQQHFGRGIVATANDFGRLGQPPTHPELLDWLAVTFVEGGWSLKDLHRLILMSAAWRQSAHHPQAEVLSQQDPAGDLLWRARVRRLTAEQIRDAMLTATGELDPARGGPSVDARSRRRALYVKVYRNTPDEFLHAFDMANGLQSVPERLTTTTPMQSLLLINGEPTLERAAALTQRVVGAGHPAAADLLDDAFRRAWNRSPSSDELTDALAFVDVAAEADPSALDLARLADFCHVLLSANQFLYLD